MAGTLPLGCLGSLGEFKEQLMPHNLLTNRVRASGRQSPAPTSVCHTPSPPPAILWCWKASHLADTMEYSSRQSLKENQLPCLCLYQRFAIKRIKFPSKCGMGLLHGKNLLMWGESLDTLGKTLLCFLDTTSGVRPVSSPRLAVGQGPF